jgi:hypothetical protein
MNRYRLTITDPSTKEVVKTIVPAHMGPEGVRDFYVSKLRALGRGQCDVYVELLPSDYVPVEGEMVSEVLR